MAKISKKNSLKRKKFRKNSLKQRGGSIFTNGILFDNDNHKFTDYGVKIINLLTNYIDEYISNETRPENFFRVSGSVREIKELALQIDKKEIDEKILKTQSIQNPVNVSDVLKKIIDQYQGSININTIDLDAKIPDIIDNNIIDNNTYIIIKILRLLENIMESDIEKMNTYNDIQISIGLNITDLEKKIEMLNTNNIDISKFPQYNLLPDEIELETTSEIVTQPQNIETEVDTNKKFIIEVVKKLKRIQSQIKSCSEESSA